ncbi:hypothetical protein [Rhodococcus sp. (in: high G+C Gram-positive bacteria)]|uniref:hypothetical protein n=1 Tax=Rhodococcus sp. TaxID=1831 RepID=UPI00257FE7CB|nr:hypothetical protein [Rhodococcus sp. (in: high G+C Gram-positive bacteria)]MBQ7805725.1 hypothetical protein [Rhodococcus sp. (in: high G+C Gram-positive bacteria)]
MKLIDPDWGDVPDGPEAIGEIAIRDDLDRKDPQEAAALATGTSVAGNDRAPCGMLQGRSS